MASEPWGGDYSAFCGLCCYFKLSGQVCRLGGGKVGVYDWCGEFERRWDVDEVKGDSGKDGVV